MENIENFRYIGNYVAVIMQMLEILVVILSIFIITFLNLHREKINKILFYVFQLIAWLVLLTGLFYVMGGIIPALVTQSIK